MSAESHSENLNLLWASLLVEELFRQGVHQYYISPGSRNSPLVIAIARHTQLQTQIVYDERSAAFLALGYARSQHRAAVVVCTSGSALFHYYPAVLEAAQECLPLLILSADRPPELQDCGANQSIKQTDAFASFTRWNLNLPCPSFLLQPEYLLSAVDQAVEQLHGSHSGPVHINMPFREPLTPVPEDIPSTYLASLAAWEHSKQPFTQNHPAEAWLSATSRQDLMRRLNKSQSGLLLVGRLERLEDQLAVKQLARHLHWPVIADLLSGLRLDPQLQVTLNHSDLLLASSEYRQALQPHTILQIGSGFISGPLLKHLASLKPVQFISVTSEKQRQDPNLQADLHLNCQASILCREILHHLPPQAGNRWSQPLYQASQQASQLLQEQSKSFEPVSIIRSALQCLPDQSLLFCGNSLTIRVIDTFADTYENQIQVFANRGLSGIDGNLSSALGVAQAEKKPLLLCCGDLTLLHDLNALQVASNLKTPFVILLFNNHGGGIFHHLPIAEYTEVFETWFGTPHAFSFKGAAEMFGIPYQQALTLDSCTEALQSALKHQGPSLIEVHTDRHSDYLAHQAIKQKLRQQLRPDS